MKKARDFQLGMAEGDGDGGPDEDRTRLVHVVSRTAGREILFGDDEKEEFRKILFKQLKFSGLRALAWCFMGNHFLLLLEIPDKEKELAGWTEDDFIDRLSVLGGEYSTKLLLGEVRLYRGNGHVKGVAEIAERVRARLFDLSAFMKELKQKMTLAYNKRNGRVGALWEGRFKCVLLEGGEAVCMVAAYIDLNPVRAGLVEVPEDYRWCGYAAAVAGVRSARAGIVSAVSYRRRIPWSRAAESYRELLYGMGWEVAGGSTPDGRVKGRCGIDPEKIAEVRESRGKLPLAMVLRCRVRYFTDGAVLGSQEFVDRFFERRRADFGSRRKDGGRRMKGAVWGGLRVLRALKDNVING